MFAAVALTFAAGPLSAQPAGKPVAKFTLPGLWQEFIQNQVGFEERYGGKLIEVSGPVEKVRRIDKATREVLLVQRGGGLYALACRFGEGPKLGDLGIGQTVTIRGVLSVGRDRLTLTRCRR